MTTSVYLTAKQATGDVKEVYRLDTAGGNPPKTCSGMPPSVGVDYSAIYWFWANGLLLEVAVLHCLLCGRGASRRGGVLG